MKFFKYIFFIGIVFFGFVSPVRAVEVLHGQTAETKESDLIQESLVVASPTVDIKGTVNGDIFCVGKTVTISAKVLGDIICAASDLTISGPVSGNIRVAAAKLTISGHVGTNATMIAQTISISEHAAIVGETLFGAETFSQQGTLGPIFGYAKTMSMEGIADGDVSVTTGALSLGNGAVINGSLSYTSDTQAAIDAHATVSGAIARKMPDKPAKASVKNNESSTNSSASWPANAVPSILFNLLLSLVIATVLKKYIHPVAETIETRGVFASVIGLGAIFAMPIMLIMLALTIIGIFLIPVPIIAVVVLIAFGRIVTAMVFGKAVLVGFGVQPSKNLYLQSLIGVPVLWFLYHAPYVGGMLTFFSILLAFGATILAFRKKE